MKSIDQKLRKAHALHHQGDLSTAATLYKEILLVQPDNFDSLHLLGLIAHKEGNYTSAVSLISQAIEIHPSNANFYSNLGISLFALDEIQASLHCYEVAITLEPEFAMAYNNRANALKKQKRYSESSFNFYWAIDLNANYAEAYNNLGVLLREIKRPEAALVHYDRAIGLNNQFSEAFYNRANSFWDLNQLDQAIENYKKAIQLNRHHANAYFNKSITLLLKGLFEEGWDLYDWRWKSDEFDSPFLVTHRPLWDGDKNQVVLLWTEQGIGDEFMFLSLINEFKTLCKKLIVQVDNRSMPLVSRSIFAGITFIPKTLTVDPMEYDAHLPLASLGKYLRRTKACFKLNPIRYLIDEKQRTSNIRSQIQAVAGVGKKICGISWRSKNEKNGQERSFTLSDLIEQLSLKNYQLVNLQYGDVQEEIEVAQQLTGQSVLSVSSVDNFYDMDGLASLIMACDVVVSADNTTVHLAGALGQDVRILLPFKCDWRWMLERQDSLWYPTVRLYRQDEKKQWEEVLNTLRADLLNER